MTKIQDTWLWCKLKEADTEMLFHVGHLMAPNNVAAKTAHTDTLIIPLTNIEKQV